MKTLFIFLFVWLGTFVFAQLNIAKNFTLSGYADLYYSYDFSNPPNHEKTDFLYTYKKHNQPNINLLLIEANYASSRVKANLGLMAGTYAHYNLINEPEWAKFLYEANVGIKLLNETNLWVEAGILNSHIGFENEISADGWTLTRSLVTEESPAYETGIKLAYTSKNKKLNFNFLVLNGWQKIQTPNYIKLPAFGLQFTYKFTPDLLLNYSNFLGNDKPDSLKAFRNFHDFFVEYNMSKKWELITGFDIGIDKYNAQKYGVWFAPTAIVRYLINNKWNIAFRGEYYNDKNQIIVTTNTLHGFQILGVSTNITYKIIEKIQCELECKMYDSKDKIFNNSHENYTITANLTFRL